MKKLLFKPFAMTVRRFGMGWLKASAVLGGQMWDAVSRPDLPHLVNQNPSWSSDSPHLPPLRIVALGDSSITAPGVEPLDDCWVRRVARHLAKEYDVTLISVATGGAKASDVLQYQVPAAKAHHPDLALVCVGANDSLRGVPVRQYERELTTIVKALKERIPLVAVSGLGDLGTLPRLPAIGRACARIRSRSFDRAIARVVYGSEVVKTCAWGPEWDGFRDSTSGVFAADMFHASGQGHALVAESWISVLDQMGRPAPSERPPPIA